MFDASHSTTFHINRQIHWMPVVATPCNIFQRSSPFHKYWKKLPNREFTAAIMARRSAIDGIRIRHDHKDRLYTACHRQPCRRHGIGPLPGRW
eukprot:scaffold308033_cov13-Prasinocladus_malaysianus.AAC.1